MTGYELQYISTTDGAFNSVLAQNVTQDSIIEAKFLSTDYSNILYFGTDNADIRIRHWWGDDDMYWYNGGIFVITSLWTLNEEHTVSFSASEYKWNGVKVYDVNGTCNIPATPKFVPIVNGRLYYFKITDNGVDKVNLVAWQDGNGNLGLYDKVNDVFYTPSSGTWTAGPVAHTFSINKSNARFAASGGTETVEIEAETTWTASTPSFVSVSPSTGDTGTTQVTISCPSYTGATRREDDITFTDNDNYTLTFKARQNGNSAGFSNMYLGDNNLLSNTIYIGDNAVNTIYLGEEIIYSNGPFVGLKAAPQSLVLNSLITTVNITIRSSENWALTDDSGGWLSYSTTTGTTGKTVVTVTASTTQTERTSTITVTSANYSATIGVTQKVRLYMVPNDEIWYHQTGNDPIYPLRPYGQNDSWFVETDLTTRCWILSNTYDSNDGWWKIKWSGPLGQTAGTGFGNGCASQMTEVMMPETMNGDFTHNWTYSTNLKKICYGASIERIEDSTFQRTYFEEIYIYALTCPTIANPNTQWNYYGGTGVTLHYPIGSDYSSFPLPPNSTRIGDL